MKYLKKFNQASEYEAFKAGDEYITPNVSYVVEGSEVKFEKSNKIVYPVHVNIAQYADSNGSYYLKGEPSLALLFEALWPIASEHFTEWVHPSSNTAFDVSAYATWEYYSSDDICSNIYAVRSYDTTYFGEHEYEDSNGNLYYDYYYDGDVNITVKPLENIIKVDSIYTSYSGGESIKRYATSDGKYFYSLWFD